MDFLSSLPKQILALVMQWLVPLVILYNIVGWAGLPGREAGRSTLSEQDLSVLRRSVRAAWFLAIIVALAGLTAIFKFGNCLLQEQTSSVTATIIVGILGAALGVFRGWLPRSNFYRAKPPISRRRILAGLVICAVAVSLVSGVLYYNSGQLLRGLIAADYLCLFIGYAATYVFEVGK